jgi:hypothetical protein
MKGPVNIRFREGPAVTFEMPKAKISGILLGKRVLEWFGEFRVRCPEEQIEAIVSFYEKPGFFSSAKWPTDCIEGKLLRAGQQICTIGGSWLENLKFNNQVYWDFDTSDLIRPHPIATPLPSDCRYREDLLALMNQDMELAQR